MAGKILVLDDEDNYAEMLCGLLHAHHYRVDVTTRPDWAIQQLKQIHYQLIVSDYKMPVMNGAEFLKEVHQIYPNLPVIFISGLMNMPELLKVANMGVTLVLEKPLDTSVFLSHVAKFVEPIAPEEQQSSAPDSSGPPPLTAAVAQDYPDEPRLFSARSVHSTQFMREAWNKCEHDNHLLILEPPGGDAALAVQDISRWRGHQDRPVQEFKFEEWVSGGVDSIKASLANVEMSQVCLIDLASIDQLIQVHEHLAAALQAIDSVQAARFIYRLTGTLSDARVVELIDCSACTLPALSQRPADVAHYVRRLARLFANQHDKPNAATITPDAAYAILAFDWPENYRQIEEVVSTVIARNENAPLTLEAFDGLLGHIEVPMPQQRMEAFMQRAQIKQLQDLLLSSGDSLATLASRLKLNADLQTVDDLKQLPLIEPHLATF